jgi:release factor glutamine methyltransferase
LLKKRKDLLCDFADKEKKSMEQIKINCKLNNINEKRYKIIQSDIFAKVKGKYDYIFANPPYVAIKKIYNIQKSVLKYEPKSALFGGSDGLYYIKKFLAQAKNRLNPHGKIFMEFSGEQKPAIEKIILKNKYLSFEFMKDQNDRWRWVRIAS